MSLQQQCLPLPRRRKRHVYNQNNNDKDEDGDSNRYNKNNNQSSSMDTTDNNNETPQQISDLSEMDASTYLASVSAQASNLPFVFTAPVKVKVKEDSLGGGEKDETIQRNEKGKNDQREVAMWQGSATSVQYLFSQRLKLVPPPSIHYLPPIVVNSATDAATANASANQNDNADDYSQSMQDYSQFVMNNFSKLRLYLHQCRNGDGNSKSSGNSTTILQERKIPVPPSKDSYNWHIFCLGKNEARGNIGGYYDVSSSSSSSEDEDENENEKNRTTNKFKKFNKKQVPQNGYEPTTSLLCQFDQIIVRRVISHHLHYITEGYRMSVQRGKWMYALLARLEKPLHRDEASSLSSLLRELCRLRSELSVNDIIASSDGDTGGFSSKKGGNYCSKDILSILNTLIVVVGVYFEQCSSLDSIMSIKIH